MIEGGGHNRSLHGHAARIILALQGNHKQFISRPFDKR